MKITITLALMITATAAYAQTPPTPQPVPKVSFAQRPEINAVQAEKDIQAGHFRFYTYGLVRVSNFKVADLLKKDYNIDIRGAAGCIVSRDLVKRIHEYNELMDKAVLKKYGKTYKQLYEEARVKVEAATPAAPPTSG